MQSQATPSLQQLADAMVEMFDIPISQADQPDFFLYDRNTGDLAIAPVKKR
ncbi:MAG TPA: hypothetical protein VME66_07610 [Candidatus Acidoferrales bacterium]|nr:hypothetical protein [Candidatus Acidoferrales bacterium]